MVDNIQNIEKSFAKMMIALFFDSGSIDDTSYGGVVFNVILKGKELQNNSVPVIISVGDIFEDSYQDISPYVVKNSNCTIDFTNNENYTNFKDWPYCWIIEDIDYTNATTLDSRLKKELPQAYKGLSSIDTSSTDSKKQFWKHLIRLFSINRNIITVFGLKENGFGYREYCETLDLQVLFDEKSDFEGYETDIIPEGRASSFVYRYSDIETVEGKNDVERSLLEMNFSLVKEVSISGVFIWKAIEDIEKIHLPETDSFPYITDHLFTSLYQASQGVERLQKIIIELANYKDKIPFTEHKKLEELLMSHNHIGLNDWIIENTKSSKLSHSCNKLFILLKDFYNIGRYYRFSRNTDSKFESTIFRLFGSGCNKDNFLDEIKHLYGKALGEVSNFYYGIIKNICFKMNIYVYEISSTSPAYIVFMNSIPKHDLYEIYLRINNAKKEVFWWLVKNSKTAKLEKIFGEFSALEFDPAMIPHYLDEIIVNRYGSSELYDEVDQLYDDLFQKDKENAKERLNIIDVIIANPNVHFDWEEEDEDPEESTETKEE